MKPFEIFRTGRHTSVQGTSLAFAEGDLAAMVAGYDPAIHHAPIVIGHPKQDAPAYGWVDGLDISGDRLVARPGSVDAAFAELVKDGKFRKVSAAFYPPSAANNPTPGAYYLRHVGFLGAAPPAVKGLKAVEFADGDDIVTLEFADWPLLQTAGLISRLFRGLRDHIIAQSGVEQADRTLPAYDIDELGRISAEAAKSPDVVDEPSTQVFAEPATPDIEDIAMTDKAAADAVELERRAAVLESREAAFSERERTRRADEDRAFVGSVVTAGRLPKGLEDVAVALFADLGEDVISFADGDDTREMAPREAMRELLSSLPVPVITGEIAKGAAGSVDFSDPIQIAEAITSEIRAAEARGETLSAADAAARLHKGV